ncbi:hypothetical protein [Klebsiella huaxiensis]|nr:hypothetical protein [Klebsiella huaxiensis]
MRSIASGKYAAAEALALFRPGGAALTGLQISSRLRARSPHSHVKRRLRE